MPKRMKCCLCDNSCDCEYGHNPEPVIDMRDSRNVHLRCCDSCNTDKVIVARVKFHQQHGKPYKSTIVWTDEQRRSFMMNLLRNYLHTNA